MRPEIFSCYFFLWLYFMKPHEWMPLLLMFKPVQLSTLIGLVAIYNRFGGIRKSMLLRTPHDRWMWSYLFYICYTSGRFMDVFHRVKPVFLFYLVIICSINSWKQLEKWLGFWISILLACCAMALLSLVGFDPAGGADITRGYMKGRLIFNISIMSNPNALGHTVVPCIPLVYYMWMWKRPIFVKIPAAFLVLLPAFTVWNTQSKGSYLAGSVTLLVGGLYKRHWILQVAVVMFASGSGMYLLNKLPRMNELDKDEGGIQGRELAFSYGYYCVSQKAPWTGVGYKKYHSSMTRDIGKYIDIGTGDDIYIERALATHGSYVEIGATLGRIGLLFFLGTIYLNFRVLVRADPKTVQQERCLRVLFILVLSWSVSAAVIDWAFNSPFFFLAAGCSVFHRLMWLEEYKIAHADQVKAREEEKEKSKGKGPGSMGGKGPPVKSAPPRKVLPVPPKPGGGGAPGGQMPGGIKRPSKGDEDEEPVRVDVKYWNKIRWYDYLIMACLVAALIRGWKYGIEMDF